MIFMQPDAFGEERVRLIITLDELGIGGNALNEVCNGITVVDFADKMGAEESDVEQILDDIIPIYRKMEAAGSAYTSVNLARNEVRAIVGALEEVCREIDPLEFATRMGSPRSEVDQILDTIRSVYRRMGDSGTATVE
jgi:hypothetical protein